MLSAAHNAMDKMLVVGKVVQSLLEMSCGEWEDEGRSQGYSIHTIGIDPPSLWL